MREQAATTFSSLNMEENQRKGRKEHEPFLAGV